MSRDQFNADVLLVFANCRRYNRPDTEFVACANKLEPFFKARMRAHALAQAQAAAGATAITASASEGPSVSESVTNSAQGSSSMMTD